MMKKRITKLVAIAAVLVLGAAALTGCGGSEGAGKIVIAGSTSVQPLTDELASKYMEANDVTIESQGGGSGQAVVSLADDIADIGALSREVKDEEKETLANEFVIAKDGVAVITNEDVDVASLTMDQIKNIFTGRVANWSEVGGKNIPITVVSREEGSGTRGAFTELTGVLDKNNAGEEVDSTSKEAIIQPSTGAAKETVSTTPGAIGYVSMEALDETVKSINVDGVKISAGTVLDGSYKISRPFIYAVTGEVTEAAQKFIDWVMGEEGQSVIKENGFIPVK